MSIRGRVWLSKSQCIYENLAIEDWLLRNFDWSFTDGLFIWSNRPAVVIGRHQNPWREANVAFLESNEISLARRNSGGGTVFHDLGNLNLSFLTDRRRHNRKRNLQLLADCIQNHHKLTISINGRDDLLLQPADRKVSGTAAKLIRTSAYHHLTLMIDVDQRRLRTALKAPNIWIDSKATASVPSSTGCLNDECPEINKESLIETICDEFLSKYPDITKSDDGLTSLATEHGASVSQIVTDSVTQLTSWPWVFGMTPPFNAHTILLPSGKRTKVRVEKGLITDCEQVEPETRARLIGQKYAYALPN